MNQRIYSSDKDLPKFYQPFILHYQCIGFLNTSTTLNYCHGIQSKVNLLQQLPISNYTNAINAFHQWIALRDVYYHPNLKKGKVLGIDQKGLGFGGSVNIKKTEANKAIDIKDKKNSLTIIDKSFPNLNELFPTDSIRNFDYIQHYGISNMYVLIIREIPIIKHSENMNQSIVKLNSVIFDPSQLINKTENIDRLKYQVMGGKVVAVAPNMVNGIAVRGISDDKHRFSTSPKLTTINLGPMEITVASLNENKSEVKDHNKRYKYREVINTTTRKAIEHSRFTGLLIYNLVQDDFYDRVKKGGLKVISNFGKTWDSMKKFIDKFW